MELSIRIDITKDKALETVKELHSHLKCERNYLWVFEISRDKKKPHIHGYIKLESEVNLDNLGKWFRRRKYYTGKGCYAVSEVKDNNCYLDYVCKDMNVIYTDFEEDRIEALLDKALKIKIDKERPLISKLFNYVVGEYIEDYDPEVKTPLTDKEVLQKLIQFFKSKQLLHPNRTQMFQYVQTILSITNNDTSVFIDYYSVFTVKEKNL